MISAFLQGGLGNMLFQIATVASIAKDNNDECVFDFHHHSNMKRLQSRDANVYKSNIFSKLKDGVLENPSVYLERVHSYVPIQYRNNLYINGYFQTEKYFKHNRDYILELFDYGFKDDFLKEYTSIHIRRGDFKKLQHVHPLMPREYYDTAIDMIGGDKFVIFSDDIPWCKEEFRGNKFTFYQAEDQDEIYAMSKCKNNITANSSFSWWGAWLNENKDKRVICPSKWFNNSIDTKDMPCEGWEIIKVV